MYVKVLQHFSSHGNRENLFENYFDSQKLHIVDLTNTITFFSLEDEHGGIGIWY